MKTIAIIQARMGSTRLPGKVMRRLQGTTVLGHVVRRVQASGEVDEVIVATTTLEQDAVIAAEAELHGALVYRGSEDDVLSRYAEAAELVAAECVVRVTSDCPLLDSELLVEMIQSYRSISAAGSSVDYLSNVLERTYPRGLDVEVFSHSVLAQAHAEAKLAHEREHVTPYIYQQPHRFSLHHHVRIGESLASLRWTLDTDEDWELIRTIYDLLGPDGRPFSTNDILALLRERPEIGQLNAHVEQKKVGK